MPESDRHIKEEEVERYLMGAGPQEESAELEEHLLVCDGCRARISKADAFHSAMSEAAAELRGQPDESSASNWQLSRILPAVTALACLLLLGILVLREYLLRIR